MEKKITLVLTENEVNMLSNLVAAEQIASAEEVVLLPNEDASGYTKRLTTLAIKLDRALD